MDGMDIDGFPGWTTLNPKYSHKDARRSMPLKNDILRTLLYYEIWSHPLTSRELFAFLPVNSMTFEEFHARLNEYVAGEHICEHGGYYFIKGEEARIVVEREQRARRARRMWGMARLITHVIKRCPFVRGVFVSGELSKNVAQRNSDIDFSIITELNRLWIARMLLTLFKKTILFNNKKFFCLNFFATTDHLRVDEENIYTAMEVATTKPLFNSGLFLRYLEANTWIRSYFPNFNLRLLDVPAHNDRPSRVQRLLELPFRFFNATALDEYCMRTMEAVWAKRYPMFDEVTRKRIFRCTRTESRAYAGNFQDAVLLLYQRRLKECGLTG